MFRQLYRLINNRNLHTSSVLQNKIYTDTHEWLVKTENYTKIGLSKYAVDEMGEIIYIDYTDQKEVEKDEEIITLESIKAAADVRSPFDGTILEVNTNLQDNLELINSNPECEDNCWLIKIKA